MVDVAALSRETVTIGGGLRVCAYSEVGCCEAGCFLAFAAPFYSTTLNGSPFFLYHTFASAANAAFSIAQ
jgi:hypothetical protein